MKESFSPKESKYCVKCCQDREVGQVSKKGGTGCVWREMGVFLEARKDPGKRRQNAFLNVQVLKSSELQTSVSVRTSRLRHPFQSVTAVGYWRPCLEIAVRGSMAAARYCSFHIASVNVFFPR